jgi:hypothetical protein
MTALLRLPGGLRHGVATLHVLRHAVRRERDRVLRVADAPPRIRYASHQPRATHRAPRSRPRRPPTHAPSSSATGDVQSAARASAASGAGALLAASLPRSIRLDIQYAVFDRAGASRRSARGRPPATRRSSRPSRLTPERAARERPRHRGSACPRASPARGWRRCRPRRPTRAGLRKCSIR